MEVLREALADAKRILWCANDTYKHQNDSDSDVLRFNTSEIFTKYLGRRSIGGIADPIWKEDVHTYMRMNNCLLYYILDDVKELPNNELASQYANDRPELKRASPSSGSTKRLLKGDKSVELLQLEKLRFGDARTIIVQCAKRDRVSENRGKHFYAEMHGCVMTIYPIAFTKPTRLRHVRPMSYISEYAMCLSAVLIHELTHYKFAHNAVDYQLFRTDYNDNPTSGTTNQFFRPGEDYKYCYGHHACVALANSKCSDQAINNADSPKYIAVTLALSRTYPDVCFTTDSGLPEKRDTKDIDTSLRKIFFFQHRDAALAKEDADHTTYTETVTDLTLDDEFLSNGPQPEKDNIFDECIEGMKYGGNGRLWGL